jgi:hypothetical protein
MTLARVGLELLPTHLLRLTPAVVLAKISLVHHVVLETHLIFEILALNSR